MSDSLIYLDHNSTTPLLSSAAAVMVECLAQSPANPASQHRAGQTARRTLERYRRDIVDMLGGRTSGMETDTLIVTSGGTESNNLALFGLADLGRQQRLAVSASAPQRFRVLISAIEHPAVYAAAEHLARSNYDVRRIPVDSQGVCDLEALAGLLSPETVLVSLMLANNETGARQPVEQAAEMCHAAGVLIHTDAVQGIGKLNVKFGQLQVDALSFTAHKLGGPRGVGGLLLRHGLLPTPMMFGGFQQMAIRPGTESVCLVAGMHQALASFCDDPKGRYDHLARLRDRLESLLVQACPDAVVHSAAIERTPQTLNIAFPGIDRQSFLMAADMAGIAVSAGSACASGSSEPSPVLTAMGLDRELIKSSIRISVGHTNSMEEIEEAARRIGRVLAQSK